MGSLPSHADILAKVGHYRTVERNRPADTDIVCPGPGQVSVWDFPRPPDVRDVTNEVCVEWAGELIARSNNARMIVETSGAPVYMLPPDDVRTDRLVATDHITLCEWKGAAVHYDLVSGMRRAHHAAFSYPDPLTDLGCGYETIAGWFAFYPARVDVCLVGGVRATAQPGGYYAGWITPDVTGPFKGCTESEGW